jgi:hypothetical protein
MPISVKTLLTIQKHVETNKAQYPIAKKAINFINNHKDHGKRKRTKFKSD